MDQIFEHVILFDLDHDFQKVVISARHLEAHRV